jgi:hypothetical protein
MATRDAINAFQHDMAILLSTFIYSQLLLFAGAKS